MVLRSRFVSIRKGYHYLPLGPKLGVHSMGVLMYVADIASLPMVEEGEGG